MISIPDVERLLDIGAMLADATFLWYPLTFADPGDRLLCKLSYLIPGEKIESLPRRIGRSLSWVHPAEYIPLWHSGADANFHAELEAPPVMRIRAVEANFHWFTEDGPASETERATEEAQDAGLRPDQYIDIEGGLAHVYVAGRRPLGADLITTLAPMRAAVLPMFFATMVIGLLASAFYAWRGQMSDPTDRGRRGRRPDLDPGPDRLRSDSTCRPPFVAQPHPCRTASLASGQMLVSVLRAGGEE